MSSINENEIPSYIRVRGHLYTLSPERTATKFKKDVPEAALLDPTKIELTDAQISALARSIMVAFAYAMVMNGIKSQADLKEYKEESLMQQIPRVLQKLATNRSAFAAELRDLRSRGPERYLKEVGRSLQSL